MSRGRDEKEWTNWGGYRRRGVESALLSDGLDGERGVKPGQEEEKRKVAGEQEWGP